MSESGDLRIALISLHGLIRGENPELGRDEDTGGQTRYVIELARTLAQQPEVGKVELITRQIIDNRVSEDYARLDERIGDDAYIVRIPFGPKRYLSKTKLWPYLDVFVDECLNYFKRTRRVPDVIHGHYADAGYGGGQIARLLGVPFVFTGHSLGRIKKERLIESGASETKIEKNYNLSQRIEAEEFALDTCSLIVTSTHQEVKEQYERYEQYIPERMEVIPPGVDLASFRPPREEDEDPQLLHDIQRFLDDPDKPMIVAMARPDERKNLEMLVKTFGESPELQRLANLVLIMGCRDDIRSMPSGQKTVLTNVLTLIDVYDLYGKVAYPKQHQPSEVPALYRAITRSRGIFINPAMTEPFGLTLLEAAASGAPIVATNDGGPNDIIANCQNGTLINPFDPKEIEKALVHLLIDPEAWDSFSRSGLEKVHQHYSWERHCQRYLRDIMEIVEKFDAPMPIVASRRVRRLHRVDRLILTDIDNTLTGDDDAMERFFELLANTDEHVGFGIATGRRFEKVKELMEEKNLPHPEVLITAVGTEIYYGKNLTLDRSWQNHIGYGWNREKTKDVLDQIDGLYYPEDEGQSFFKLSYKIDLEKAPNQAQIKRILRQHKLKVKTILSHNMYLDIIPSRAGSGLSIRHLAFKWDIPMDHILIAGDSGNDEGMLSGNTLGVVVGNYSKELEVLRGYPRVYFAKASHAAGIIEGINYYNFLDNITIPNDKSDDSND
jgi:sucrose-phosphate synthase